MSGHTSVTDHLCREIAMLRDIMLALHCPAESHWLAAAVAFPLLCNSDAAQQSLRRAAAVAEQIGFHNVTHWLNTNPVGLTALRAEPGAEFLASTDIWFRPVQMANGPDGALYVLDMYRYLIEATEFMPPSIVKFFMKLMLLAMRCGPSIAQKLWKIGVMTMRNTTYEPRKVSLRPTLSASTPDGYEARAAIKLNPAYNTLINAAEPPRS